MSRLFSIVGDSISTFEGCNPSGYNVYYKEPQCSNTGVLSPEDTWWQQVIDYFDGSLLVNGSFSGSMVEGVGFPAGNSNKRVTALASDGMTPTDIIVFMGINDYGWGGPDAQAAGGSEATPISVPAVPRKIAGKADPKAVRLFGAAYGSMLKRLRTAYPMARVWCCTLTPGFVAHRGQPTFTYCLRGIPFDAYCDAIRNAADENRCDVVDLRALKVDYEAVDGTHPTKRGMQQLAAMIQYCIEQKVAPSDGAVPDFAGALPSRERCMTSTCVGCEYAHDTGNTWACVCDRDAS